MPFHQKGISLTHKREGHIRPLLMCTAHGTLIWDADGEVASCLIPVPRKLGRGVCIVDNELLPAESGRGIGCVGDVVEVEGSACGYDLE